MKPKTRLEQPRLGSPKHPFNMELDMNSFKLLILKILLSESAAYKQAVNAHVTLASKSNGDDSSVE